MYRPMQWSGRETQISQLETFKLMTFTSGDRTHSWALEGAVASTWATITKKNHENNKIQTNHQYLHDENTQCTLHSKPRPSNQ